MVDSIAWRAGRAMPIHFLALVLFAASLHATWNAIVKGAEDKLLTTILVASMAGALAALALPFLQPPAAASWPFIAASFVCQILYYVLLANAYRFADMSRAYPLMRGTAPLLVATLSATIVGETLSATAWLGLGLISCGIIGLAASPRGGASLEGIGFALGNAMVIAAYTLIDGLGVRRSGAPLAYTMWVFLLPALPLAGWALATKKAAFGRFAVRHLRRGLIGGAATLTAYGLALWAMTMAPVAIVAALRETSILFATAISALVLKERVSPARWAIVCVIAAGVVVLRLV